MQVRLTLSLAICSLGGGMVYTCGAFGLPLVLEMVFSMGAGKAALLTLHLNSLPLSQSWCMMGSSLTERKVLLICSSRGFV